jgi:homoserine dehydrogenase
VPSVSAAVVPVRVSVVGLGTVGRWLVGAIERHRDALAERESIELRLVAVANRRQGFVYRESGIQPAIASGASIGGLEGVARWPTALAGIEATETDVLVEVTQSPAGDGEPGLSHMRAAIARGASVATSNKWPVALAGVELARLAAARGVAFRAESTVMSGTPVLSTLTDGLVAARPRRLRGVLNATANFICSRIAAGAGYAEALTEARAAGLAEADPSDDVDGRDSAAKLMVLSALVFEAQLARDDIAVRGISSVAEEEFRAAAADGQRVIEVSTLDPDRRRFAVEPLAVGPDARLFAVDGTANAVHAEIEPLGELEISGPGAGPALAGQGVFSDLVAIARQVRLRRSG